MTSSRLNFLISSGFSLARRDPTVKPGFPGKWMLTCAEDDFAIVGDDQGALVDEVFRDVLAIVNTTVLPEIKPERSLADKLRDEVMMSKKTHNFTFSRDELIELLQLPISVPQTGNPDFDRHMSLVEMYGAAMKEGSSQEQQARKELVAHHLMKMM